MKIQLVNLVLLLVSMSLLISACASKRSVEIGDPTLSSPEEHHHYLTIHEAFTRHDTNGDGYLDRHEFDQLQVDSAIVQVRAAIAEIVESGPLMFEEIDEDEDEFITLNELTVIIQPLLPPRQ